ncbi:hypothetical protein F6S87_02835 [Bifidobacterium sp. BRDM6]|uniref:Uncharacterized protein n=1 Tax=Bifidobacterium choloepi TaxID=2614131 RepID=A0A6I5N6Z3_9BIFI|nr:hypothetical protein [Bifidobacterium choloepi]
MRLLSCSISSLLGSVLLIAMTVVSVFGRLDSRLPENQTATGALIVG